MNNPKIEPAKPAANLNFSNISFNTLDYIKPGVTADFIEEIKETFDLYDNNNSGTVQLREIKLAIQSLGFETKVAEFFNFNPGKETSINFQEFFNIMTSQMTEIDTKQDIKKIFALFDVEKTGFINVKNLRKFIRDLGETCNDDELIDIIQKGDLNGDSLVSFDDFYNILTKKVAFY